MIEKIKKLRELRGNLHTDSASDGYTSEEREAEIKKLEDEIMDTVSAIGWLIVYVGLIPLMLYQAGMDEETGFVVWQIIAVGTLLPYGFVRVESSTPSAFAGFVIYLFGLTFILILLTM